VSLALAVVLNRALEAVGLYRTLYFIPVVTSIMASVLVWKYLYRPEDIGLFNMMLCRADGRDPLEDLSLRTLSGTSFEVQGLSPGVWGLSVTTTEGLVGVLGGIVLGPGQRRDDLVLRLEPGAELRVRNGLAGELAGSFLSVHADGACVGWNGVQPGDTAVFRVPGGRLRVLATLRGRIVREVALDVLSGEVREVVLE